MATATATKKPKNPLPTSKSELLERFKDYPGIKAFERALESPEGPGSLPILLADESPRACVDTGHQNQLKLGAVKCLCGKPARKWYVRHVNTKQQGRVAQIKAKGFIPAALAEVLHKDEIADLIADSPDGLVHTGINGAKVLYKIPLDLYNARKRAERDARERRGKSAKRVREDLANDAGRTPGFGAQAADTIYGDLEYSEKTIRSTLADEAVREEE